ncbi:hypothetical protein GGP41_009302 [Bipolaris sorokiniana]|uniref:Polycomb protein VEFS-Box domain-containing protein n=1 Tax=Cochliobolus sativus TaxID=45130 RepID=A0A8H5ZF03_COCSA|nr:hypothetical protein GGP41_009302 [Bipolaris sorokiniana]
MRIFTSRRRDRFSGNILLYDYLSRKRAPIFLDRNLTQILDAHEDLFKGGDRSGCRTQDFDFRSQWKPPSSDQLDKMMAQENYKDSLVLEVHAINSHNGQTTAHTDRDHNPANKIRVLMRLCSSIRVSIIPPSDAPATRSFAREALLRGADRSHQEASVETSPIILKPRDFSAEPGKISIHDMYRMILSVNFASQADAQELYNYLGLTEETATHLSTSYPNILECPPDKISLPLKAAGKPLGISIQISMYWNSTGLGDSILANHNRNLRSATESQSSYPTPPRDLVPRYKLTYVYGNETLERSDLVCLHCSRGKKLKEIRDLEMHLNAWHDNFAYQLVPAGTDANGVAHWRFISEVADSKADQRASGRADEPRDVRVLAPDRPFDKRRFLEGDDTYQRAARVDRHLKYPKRKQIADILQPPAPRQRKPPNAIQERPPKHKKTFIVPKAPRGITFFRSLSKRPLQPGESISESDDELDESWMHLRKHAEIDKHDLSLPARHFLKLFDDFMHEESLHADIHAGDAIIRFARRRNPVWNEDLIYEFAKKLKELLEDDVISKDVHDAAIEIVEVQKKISISNSESNSSTSNELSRRLAELDVQRGEDAEPPFDKCYCGGDAAVSPGTQGIIACRNIDCIRRVFHHACIQKHSKYKVPAPDPKSWTWTCDDCRDEGVAAT